LPSEYQNLFLDPRTKTVTNAAALTASKLVVRTADLYEKA